LGERTACHVDAVAAGLPPPNFRLKSTKEEVAEKAAAKKKAGQLIKQEETSSLSEKNMKRPFVLILLAWRVKMRMRLFYI
jgi:hypothetical protein